MDPTESEARRVRRFHDGAWDRGDRILPAEVPVTLYVNSSLLTTVFATPTRLAELAVGFLFGEGFIAGVEQVRDVSARADGRRGQIWVELDGPVKEAGPGRATSGCGRGITFLCPSDLEGFAPVRSSRVLAPAEILEGMRRLRGSAEASARGFHVAALMGPGDAFETAADIGRHNAVDKVLGLRLRSGGAPRDGVLLTTGRISSEMALKAAVASCPAAASLRSATSLAAEVCETLGVTLVARVRGEGFEVLTHPDRIAGAGGTDGP